ncbi:MAG: hypothetical protein GF353_10660 [Candidatus Lokiarchaeota archaeon]|nr:hypothetical protein [Candidatus Lokiarchaeota archaeon]
MSHPVFRSLQSDIRFFQHPIPIHQQYALRLTCPYKMGDGIGFPRSV